MRASARSANSLFFDAFQAARIEVDVGGEAVDVARRVRDLDGRALQRCDGAAQSAVGQLGDRLDLALRRIDGPFDPTSVAKFARRAARGLDKLLGVHHHGPLGRQRRFLARSGIEGREFVEAMAGDVFVAARVFAFTHPLAQHVHGGPPGAMRLGRAGRLFVEAAVGVEQFPLGRGIEKPAAFELAVDLDQAVAERGADGRH